MDSEMKLMWNCGTNGDVTTLVAQMKKGLDINYQNEEGRTILMRAAKRDHKDVVRILVDNGADVNKRDLNGKTALMGAAKKGNKTIVKKLMEAGADLNIQDVKGRTAEVVVSIS